MPKVTAKPSSLRLKKKKVLMKIVTTTARSPLIDQTSHDFRAAARDLEKHFDNLNTFVRQCAKNDAKLSEGLHLLAKGLKESADVMRSAYRDVNSLNIKAYHHVLSQNKQLNRKLEQLQGTPATTATKKPELPLVRQEAEGEVSVVRSPDDDEALRVALLEGKSVTHFEHNPRMLKCIYGLYGLRRFVKETRKQLDGPFYLDCCGSNNKKSDTVHAGEKARMWYRRPDIYHALFFMPKAMASKENRVQRKRIRGAFKGQTVQFAMLESTVRRVQRGELKLPARLQQVPILLVNIERMQNFMQKELVKEETDKTKSVKEGNVRVKQEGQYNKRQEL